MYEGIAKTEDVVFVLWIALIVQLHRCQKYTPRQIKQVRTSSRIVTSIILWLKYAGLFLTTLTATISCVFIF